MAKPFHNKNGKGRAKHKHNQKQNSVANSNNHARQSSPPPIKKNGNKAVQTLPLPFPSHLPVPQGDFLRNEPPYETSFQTALETSYLGLAVDEPHVLQQKHQANHPNNPKHKKKNKANAPLLETLPAMNAHRFFQTDVTQPFGLGTKCAKTYVTRCLVGDPGTSYRYLGLRMFAYSWEWNNKNNSNDDDEEETKRRRQLLQSIGDLKDRILVPQTQRHLEELQTKRRQLSSPQLPSYDVSRSRPQYNICLINRMADSSSGSSNNHDTADHHANAHAKDTTATDNKNNTTYKLEPTFEKDRIAVAWHADSSLEHYSNIAVYQLVLEDNNDNETRVVADKDKNNNWSLALRVTPNAEGPVAEQSTLTPDPNIPALSLTLPSGSAYYMLDDFNHHHQHAVLRNGNNNSNTGAHSEEGPSKTKGNKRASSPSKTAKGGAKPSNNHHHLHHTNPTTSSTIRYSATYRLLRPSHTVQEVLEQCQRACRSFHKRGMKVWRSEQLLLTYMETEWLRQFYIQGQHHHDMLVQHGHWGTYMQQLWKYWSQLEQRTRQTLDLLQHAAEGKCHHNNNTNHVTAANQKNASSTSGNTSTTTPPTKAERKKRDKQKKAFATVQDLLLRTSAASTNNAVTELYEPLAELLDERATMRTLWHKREKDHVFKTMERQYRPLPLPIRYAVDNTEKDRDHGHTGDDDDEDKRNSTTILATSPLPEDLSSVATQLRAFGRAYQSGVKKDLPSTTETACTPKMPEAARTTVSAEKPAIKPSDDNGLPVPTSGNNSDSNPGGKQSRRTKKKKRQRDQGSKRTPDGGIKKKKRRF